MLCVSKSLLSGLLLLQPGPGAGNDTFLEVLDAWHQVSYLGRRKGGDRGEGGMGNEVLLEVLNAWHQLRWEKRGHILACGDTHYMHKRCC